MIDSSLNTYLDSLDEKKDVLLSIRKKKKIFDLPPKLKANISDLIDVVHKFQEIKKYVSTTFEDEKLSVDELTEMIDNFSVVTKIINIILEDEESYANAVKFINNLYSLLASTIHSWKYVINIEQVGVSNYYNTIIKEGWVVNLENFTNLITYLQQNLEIVDYDPNNNQISFDEIIFNIFIILAYLDDNLVFNVAYVEQPYLMKQYFLYLNKFYVIGHVIQTMHEHTYYRPTIATIQANLEKLKDKATNSKEGDIGITSWGVTRKELEPLIELFKNF